MTPSAPTHDAHALLPFLFASIATYTGYTGVSRAIDTTVECQIIDPFGIAIDKSIRTQTPTES